MSILQDDLATTSRQLYFLLTQLVGGIALTILRAVEEQHGFEAWRRLCQHFEPAVATRTVGVLQSLLNPTFRGDSLQHWHEDLLKWESELRYYERDAQALSDGVKVALVLARAPSSIADVLRVQASQFADDFQKLRGLLSAYIESGRQWPGVSTPCGGNNHCSAYGCRFHAALQASRKGKGKGKGKEKSAQKGSKDGKGSKNASRGVQCWRCEGYGHMAKDCPTP
eukprot:6454847-Amphidinium_carterae.1